MPEAPHVIAVLFDYTCSTCRRTHEIIKSTVTEFANELAVVEIPVPLNRACNSAVEKSIEGRGQSCQYARLALAVWRTSPQAFRPFNEYLFSEEELMPLGLAIEHAKALTGITFNPHNDEDSDIQIARAVEIYRSLEVQKVPQLLLPNAFVTGEIACSKQLKSILLQELGLDPAP